MLLGEVSPNRPMTGILDRLAAMMMDEQFATMNTCPRSRVLLGLLMFAGRDGIARPNKATLCRIAKVDSRNLRRYLCSLQKAGMIRRIGLGRPGRPTFDGHMRAAEYEIIPSAAPDSLTRFNEENRGISRPEKGGRSEPQTGAENGGRSIPHESEIGADRDANQGQIASKNRGAGCPPNQYNHKEPLGEGSALLPEGDPEGPESEATDEQLAHVEEVFELLSEFGVRGHEPEFRRRAMARRLVLEEGMTPGDARRLRRIAGNQGRNPPALLATWVAADSQAAWKDLLADEDLAAKERGIRRRAPSADDVGPIYGEDPKPIGAIAQEPRGDA